MSFFFERIMCFAENQGFKNPNDFARNGLNWSSSEKINRLKGGDKMPSVDILLEITEKFPQLNPEWLLTNKGEMLKKDIVISHNDNRAGAIVGGNNSGNISINDQKEEIAILHERLEHKDREIALLERELKSYKDTEQKLEKANEFAYQLFERKIEDLKKIIELLQKK